MKPSRLARVRAFVERVACWIHDNSGSMLFAFALVFGTYLLAIIAAILSTGSL